MLDRFDEIWPGYTELVKSSCVNIFDEAMPTGSPPKIPRHVSEMEAMLCKPSLIALFKAGFFWEMERSALLRIPTVGKDVFCSLLSLSTFAVRKALLRRGNENLVTSACHLHLPLSLSEFVCNPYDKDLVDYILIQVCIDSEYRKASYEMFAINWELHQLSKEEQEKKYIGPIMRQYIEERRKRLVCRKIELMSQ